MTSETHAEYRRARYCRDGHHWADGRCIYCSADRESEERNELAAEEAREERSSPAASEKHVLFGQDGLPRYLCCECRARSWGPEEIARFEATVPSKVCVGCARDFCPQCSPQPVGRTAATAYEALGAEIGRLVEQKQTAYGDAVTKTGKMMRILYPDGIPPEKMGDALIVTRILDKLSRIATDRDALGESPYRDIAGYGLLGAARAEKKR